MRESWISREVFEEEGERGAYKSIAVRLFVPPLAHDESDGDPLRKGSKEADLNWETLVENKSERFRERELMSDVKEMQRREKEKLTE